MTDFSWTCKSCDAVVWCRDRWQHLQRRHKNVSLKDEEMSSLFTKSDTKYQRPATLKDYYWTCIHCSRNVVYDAMDQHLRSGVHEMVVNREIRTHFRRGELLPEFRDGDDAKDSSCKNGQEKRHKVQDYNWICNLCGDQVGYNKRKRHLLSKKHGKDNLSLAERGDVTKYFTQGALRLPVEGRMGDYNWICNLCGDEMSYGGRKQHLLSKKHGKDNLSLEYGDATKYFTQGALRLGEEGGMNDYNWICNLCGDQVGCNKRKKHLLSKKHGKDNLSLAEHGDSTKYFTQGALMSREERRVKHRVEDYNWICNLCGDEMGYKGRQGHLLSKKHGKDNLSLAEYGATKKYFTQGALISREDRRVKHRVEDYNWICNLCGDEMGYKQRKVHLLSKKHGKDNLSLAERGDVTKYFTQGALRLPTESKVEHRVEDYNWICNLCGDEMSYGARPGHLLSKKHGKDNLSLAERGDVTKYFTRGALIPSVEKLLDACYWKCKHCSTEVVYNEMKNHLGSTLHENDNLTLET